MVRGLPLPLRESEWADDAVGGGRDVGVCKNAGSVEARDWQISVDISCAVNSTFSNWFD